MATHNLACSWNNGGNDIQQGSVAVSTDVDATDRITISVPASTTDKQFDWALTFADIKTLFVKATGATLLLETNATDAAGGNAFTIPAGDWLEWHNGSPRTNPITANITTAYVTNTNTSTAGTLEICVGRDATP